MLISIAQLVPQIDSSYIKAHVSESYITYNILALNPITLKKITDGFKDLSSK